MRNLKYNKWVVVPAVISFLISVWFLLPAFGASEEALGGVGSMDTPDQVAQWTHIDQTGTGTWGFDGTSAYAGTGSGRLDSPTGTDVPFSEYAAIRFTPGRVPTGATLDLAYRKEFSGAQPASGDWTVAAELWKVGGTAPLQTFDLDAGNQATGFAPVPTQNLTEVTEKGTEYELRLVQKGRTGHDPGARLSALFDEVKVVLTYDSAPPALMAVKAIDNETVDLVFSEHLDALSAAQTAAYAISPELTVKKAVLQPDGLTVRLTTAPQTGGTVYGVTVSGVRDLDGNAIGTQNQASFGGVAPPKTAAPRVLSAVAPDNTALTVTFDTGMDPLTAENAANYLVSPTLNITGAVLEKDGVTVRLTTGFQTADTVYSLTVTGVRDRFGNEIGLAANSAAFSGNSQVVSDPHGKYMQDTNQCSLCHLTHKAPGPKLLSQKTETQICYLCHDAGGQSIFDVADAFGQTGSAATHHPVPEGSQQCSDCHNPHDGGQDAAGNDIHWTRLLQSSGDPTQHGGNGFCFSCHQNGQGDTKALSPSLYPPDGTAHNNASFVVNGTTPFNPSSGSGIRCLGCHQEHGSGLNYLLREKTGDGEAVVTGNNKSQCLQCHSAASADGRYPGQAVFDNTDANGHGLTASTKTNVSYPGVDGQAGQCLNCHDPHGTANGTAQVAMKSLRGVYNDGKTTYSAADFGFCFGCHNSSSADPRFDIQTLYNSPEGGHFIKTAGGNLSPGSKMPCETCHTLHGTTENKFGLKESLGTGLGDGRNECLSCHQAGRTVEGIVMTAPPAAVTEHGDSTKPCLTCHAVH